MHQRRSQKLEPFAKMHHRGAQKLEQFAEMHHREAQKPEPFAKTFAKTSPSGSGPAECADLGAGGVHKKKELVLRETEQTI